MKSYVVWKKDVSFFTYFSVTARLLALNCNDLLKGCIFHKLNRKLRKHVGGACGSK
jgi:hypothetical protein